MFGFDEYFDFDHDGKLDDYEKVLELDFLTSGDSDIHSDYDDEDDYDEDDYDEYA